MVNDLAAFKHEQFEPTSRNIGRASKTYTRRASYVRILETKNGDVKGPIIKFVVSTS